MSMNYVMENEKNETGQRLVVGINYQYIYFILLKKIHVYREILRNQICCCYISQKNPTHKIKILILVLKLTHFNI